MPFSDLSYTLSYPQQVLARRRFLHLMAGSTVGTILLAACKPITAPTQPSNLPAQETQTMDAQSNNVQQITANGVALHYVEQGQGDPVIFVHGGLSDYRFWEAQMERFAHDFRAIAYSQRYYYPSQNLPIVSDYTTLVDADDLVAFLQSLGLERSHIVGDSSGAYIALAMTLAHPEAVRSLVLSEPPILHWVPALPGGDKVYSEFMSTFWEPVGNAFRAGDRELALRTSLEFFIGADVLDDLPVEVRQPLEENLDGWQAFTTSPDCFPMLDQQAVSHLSMPILLLTATDTLPIHQLVNGELLRLLPRAEHVAIQGATHDMWSEQPDTCGEAVLRFLQAQT